MELHIDDHDTWRIVAALRGPDNPLVADAFKWLVTGRIRFYLLPASSAWAVIRGDNSQRHQWDHIHNAWDYLVEHVDEVPAPAVYHWSNHAIDALESVRRLYCKQDKKRQHEIDLLVRMLSKVAGVWFCYDNEDLVKQVHELVNRIRRYVGIHIA